MESEVISSIVTIVAFGVLVFAISMMLSVTMGNQIYNTFIRPFWRSKFRVAAIKSLMKGEKYVNPKSFLKDYLNNEYTSYARYTHVKLKKENFTAPVIHAEYHRIMLNINGVIRNN